MRNEQGERTLIPRISWLHAKQIEGVKRRGKGNKQHTVHRNCIAVQESYIQEGTSCQDAKTGALLCQKVGTPMAGPRSQQ